LGTANASALWSNVNGNASNYIEVVWQAGGSLKLYVNGSLVQTLATLDTSSVAAIRLGSITSTGNATSMYFDAFASKRTISSLLGP